VWSLHWDDFSFLLFLRSSSARNLFLFFIFRSRQGRVIFLPPFPSLSVQFRSDGAFRFSLGKESPEFPIAFTPISLPLTSVPCLRFLRMNAASLTQHSLTPCTWPSPPIVRDVQRMTDAACALPLMGTIPSPRNDR